MSEQKLADEYHKRIENLADEVKRCKLDDIYNKLDKVNELPYNLIRDWKKIEPKEREILIQKLNLFNMLFEYREKYESVRNLNRKFEDLRKKI